MKLSVFDDSTATLSPPSLAALRTVLRSFGVGGDGPLSGSALRIAAHFLIPLSADPGEVSCVAGRLDWRGVQAGGATLLDFATLVRLAAEPGERWLDLSAGTEGWVRVVPVGEDWFCSPPPGRGLRGRRCRTRAEVADFVADVTTRVAFGGFLP